MTSPPPPIVERLKRLERIDNQGARKSDSYDGDRSGDGAEGKNGAHLLHHAFPLHTCAPEDVTRKRLRLGQS